VVTFLIPTPEDSQQKELYDDHLWQECLPVRSISEAHIGVHPRRGHGKVVAFVGWSFSGERKVLQPDRRMARGIGCLPITVHTKGFGSYKQLLGLVGFQSLVAQGFTVAVVVLAIVTGHDNIYSLPEFSGGSDGKTWIHAGAHLFLATPISTLAGWLVGSAILFLTKKAVPADTSSTAKGKARAAGA
jgi:hypothetical protein